MRDFNDYFDIEATAQLIIEKVYDRVALQFPDSLLEHSSKVCNLLEQATSKSIFILADTTFGSCCVDQVAAEHVEADLVVHYGPACMSPTSKLPVYYVHGKVDFDIEKCSKSLLNLLEKDTKILLTFDFCHEHLIDQFSRLLPFQTSAIKLNRFALPNQLNSPSSQLDSMDGTIVYLGNGEMLSSLLISFSSSTICFVNTSTNEAKIENHLNKFFMSRYHCIQQARQADCIGIVVGTLGIAGYLDLLEETKKLLKKAGKKYYIFSVGKINPAKLGNFLEIDCFVHISCPELILALNQQKSDYLKPIVTPFELAVALCSNPQDESGELVWIPNVTKYLVSFEQLTSKIKEASPTEPELFSLMTSQLTINGQKQLSSARAAVYLQDRSWKGLETSLTTEPSVLEQGRRGVARDYEF